MPAFQSRLPIPIGLAALACAAVSVAAPAADAPGLWQVDVVAAAAAPPAKPVFLCADRRLRQSLVQALPEIAGKPCALLEPPTIRPGQFQARCQAGDTKVVASSATTGDLQRDFTVNTHMSSRPADPTQAEPRGEFVQTRRYRLLGACPAGWAIGDSAAAGANAVVNSVTGASRPLAATFSPPAH